MRIQNKNDDTKKAWLEAQEDKIKGICIELDSIMLSKASQDELDRTTMRLDKFTELEHMDYLQQVLLPKMTDFTSNVDSFVKILMDMQLVVR